MLDNSSLLSSSRKSVARARLDGRSSEVEVDAEGKDAKQGGGGLGLGGGLGARSGKEEKEGGTGAMLLAEDV